MDKFFRRKLIRIEKFSKSLGIKIFPEILLMFIEHSCFYHELFGGIEFIIADSYSQREMEEEGVHYFSIYIGNGMKFRASKVDGFRKIGFMIKRIKKRGLEGLWVKVISSKVECLESFHASKTAK